MEHGTLSRYVKGKCRCDECREASRDYARGRRAGAPRKMSPRAHEEDLRDLLGELFPYGLTQDCPAARERVG